MARKVAKYRFIRPDGTASKHPYKTRMGAARGAVREKFKKGGATLSGDSTFIEFAWNNLMAGYRIESEAAILKDGAT